VPELGSESTTLAPFAEKALKAMLLRQHHHRLAAEDPAQADKHGGNRNVSLVD
jgi:hypothetical protein